MFETDFEVYPVYPKENTQEDQKKLCFVQKCDSQCFHEEVYAMFYQSTSVSIEDKVEALFDFITKIEEAL